MRIIASDQARELVAERGGRLYVSIHRQRCCGGVQTLSTATEAPKGVEWQSAGDDAGFELFLPAALARLPDELHLAARRFPRRVEAYWNGCAWVV
jgi:hypothetical protein